MGVTDLSFLILGTSSMFLMMSAIIGFAFVFQRKLAKKAKAFREIERLMQKQELESAYFVIEGQEQERKRIAAELHDNIGGLLATLKIYSDLVLKKESESEVTRLNGKINQISETLGEEVRKLSYELDVRTLSAFGLKTAVAQLCEAINESGKTSVDSIIDVTRPISEEISLNIYRIIQEMFTNTLKHTAALKVRVEVTQIGNDLTVIFEDNGTGFDVDTVRLGMGLKNIRSRVNRVQGELTIDSSPKGTTYIIELKGHE